MSDSAAPKYPEDFTKAVEDLINNWEGGYVIDPSDPGGMTKFGISKRAYPKLDIASLTRDEAVAIYYRDYWQKYGLYKLTLPKDWTATNGSNMQDETSRFRAKVFNMGVLMGPVTAQTLAIGCETLDEYRQVCERHFQALVIKNPELGKYLAGWTRRSLA